jgi:hypothetical protein
LPNTLTTIGQASFSGCTGLEKVVLGASFSTWSSYDGFKNCSKLKEVYIPDTMKSIAGNVFNSTASNCVFYFTGTKDQLDSIKANTNTNNTAFLNAYKQAYSLSDYNAIETKSGQYIVYGYNTCDAFYNSIHKKAKDANKACEADFKCTQCDDDIAGHTPVITITYSGNYAAIGVKTVTCSCENAGTFDAAPIFEAVGYSIKENNSLGIISTYKINVEALDEFERVNGHLTFGVIMANANFGEATEFMSKNTEGKYVLNSNYGIQLEVTNREFAKINATIEQFTEKEANLNLVMSLYVVDKEGISYIQKAGNYETTVTKGKTTLYVVTIVKIAELQKVTLPFMPPANVPTGNEENN